MKTSYTFQKYELEVVLLKHLGIKRDILLDLDLNSSDGVELKMDGESLIDGITLSVTELLLEL